MSSGRTLLGRPGSAGAISPTISMIANAFRKQAETFYVHPDGTPTSEIDNIKAALRPLRQLYGNTPAADFGPKRLKSLRAHVLAPKEVIDPETQKKSARREEPRIAHLFSGPSTVGMPWPTVRLPSTTTSPNRN